MGRKRSNYVCGKCGQKGFRRTNPNAVVHYDHRTRRRRTCYDKTLVATLDPPKKFWGESELYYKLGNMVNHFREIADDLEKIQRSVYIYKPDIETSTQSVKDLNIFEKGFLKPVQMILIPYHDRRWVTNWTGWFKIQMDNFKHGPRAAGMINAILTGQVIDLYSKEKKSLVKYKIEREFTSSQVKKKELQNLIFANEILRSYALEKALENWSRNTELNVTD
jgi:hypothetical protein